MAAVLHGCDWYKLKCSHCGASTGKALCDLKPAYCLFDGDPGNSDPTLACRKHARMERAIGDWPRFFPLSSVRKRKGRWEIKRRGKWMWEVEVTCSMLGALEPDAIAEKVAD